MKTHPLHERGILVSADYRKNERELIWILQEMGRQDLFRALDYSSAQQYAVEAWKLSNDSAALQEGKLTPSKVRRIAAPIAKGEDVSQWIQTAIDLPQAQLEREVVRNNPEVLIQERIKPIYGDRSQFQCGMSEKLKEEFMRTNELASRDLRRSASYEETMQYMVTLTLKYKDPVRKAERVLARQKVSSPSELSGLSQVAPRKIELSSLSQVRSKKLELSDLNQGRARKLELSGLSQVAPKTGVKLSAKLTHQVNLRDRGECQHKTPHGKCLSQRFTEIHHIILRALGGKDTLDNLITLCSFHHKMTHGFQSKKYAKAIDSKSNGSVSECLATYEIGRNLEEDPNFSTEVMHFDTRCS